MLWRIEVKNKKEILDSTGSDVLHNIKEIGINTVLSCQCVSVYTIEGDISEDYACCIAKELLTDSVLEEFSLIDIEKKMVPRKAEGIEIEIGLNDGVMDPAEESILRGIKTLKITGCRKVKTSKIYTLKGNLLSEEIEKITDKILMNKLIQHRVIEPRDEFKVTVCQKPFNLTKVDILSAGDLKLMQVSKQRQLSLNIQEMKAIKKYFSNLKTDPTDVELETIAQTWSEHCVHKTLKSLIQYEQTDESGTVIEKKSIDNLLASTIVKATEEIKKQWCISVFKDNAGIVDFDKDDAVCFKVETHNHPSALEPYGGANTGLGGVIRDVLGTGLGAKPVASTDVFCFGPFDLSEQEIPVNILHPKRIMKGVVRGVRDYGNKMGIPTVNGAVCFDKGFTCNPLVFCGNIGIIPKTKCFKKVKPKQRIVVVGGKTGRDGIHGATFSSSELTAESSVVSSCAVQIGNPITEKKLTDALIYARDRGLYTAITDCGAGGLSSAVGEMGKECGVVVYLDRVPLKYEGLSYWEVWVSEAQERMVLSVNEENIKELFEIFSREDVQATDIGYFSEDKILKLFWDGNLVCKLDMDFLHNGLPRFARKAVWISRQEKNASYEEKDTETALKKVLSSPNVCSKEWIIRQYDHEVQGGSIIKPLVGIDSDGPSDAAVIRPKLNSWKGIIIANGINPEYGKIDPYWMAGSVIDEAIRQVISVGGDLERIAILDNFCWGAIDKPDKLGGLVRAAKACYDFAKIYRTPFISGKDSLNNEYIVRGVSISIPPTLLISSICVIDDVRKTVSMDFKKQESLIYVVGSTYNEIGGTVFSKEFSIQDGFVPKVRPYDALNTFKAVQKAIKENLILSCHDCSEGGIGVAVSEAAFSGGLGAIIDIKKINLAENITSDAGVLFSESNSRFILEVNKKNLKDFEKIMKNINFSQIGKTIKLQKLRIIGLDNKATDIPIEELKNCWKNSMSRALATI
ncbi:phosphoribosylformylglycinamidine synthase II [bacterium Unc6]|nr:phosphoribosylformylglycinamidine synthase II [bacterium Unc6]